MTTDASGEIRARVCPDRDESVTVFPQPWPRIQTAISPTRGQPSTAATSGQRSSSSRRPGAATRAATTPPGWSTCSFSPTSSRRPTHGYAPAATTSLYAIRQNLRLEARRRARERGEPWPDPYPGLQAPTEHTGIVITRGIKLWIALGVLLVMLAVIGFFAAAALFSTSTTDVTVRLVNDTGSRATVRGCDDSDCVTFWAHADLDPGLSTERDVPVDDVVAYFEVQRSGRTECLPLRVHDAYERSGEQASLLVARLSAATPCPGITCCRRSPGKPGSRTPVRRSSRRAAA